MKGSFRPAALAAWSFALLLGGAWVRLNAATLVAEPLNTSNDQSAPDVRFNGVLPGGRFFTPSQYVRVRYTPNDGFNPFRILHGWGRPPRTLRVYTRNVNPLWLGEAGQFNGLLKTDNSFRIPLFRRGFDVKQSTPIVFNAGNLASWTQVRDPRDTDWAANQASAALPMYQTGRTFVYLGADRATYPIGPYGSPLVFELFNQVVGTRSPTIFHIPFTRINDLLRGLRISCEVDEDINVVEATLHYRVAGSGSPWKTLPFTIEDDLNSPFIFHLSAVIPPGDLSRGRLEYWFTVTDEDLQDTPFASDSAPQDTALNDVAQATMTVVGGGRVEYLDSIPEDGIVSFFAPRGALRRDSRVRLQRLAASLVRGLPAAPHAAPGTPPRWPVIEVSSPDATGALKKQGLLTLVYDDLDGDGLVDGTNVPEEKMRIFFYDGFEWIPIGGTVDASLNEVRAPIVAFGQYAVFPGSFAPPTTLKPRQAILSPGLQDGTNDFAFFDGAGPGSGSVIRILDVRGHLVREIRDLGMWDARNEQGTLVESGVYIYQVESGGKKAAGTITVAK